MSFSTGGPIGAVQRSYTPDEAKRLYGIDGHAVSVEYGPYALLFGASAPIPPGTMVELVDNCTVRPVGSAAKEGVQYPVINPIVTESPCPNCSKPNDVGVSKCWWCEGRLK